MLARWGKTLTSVLLAAALVAGCGGASKPKHPAAVTVAQSPVSTTQPVPPPAKKAKKAKQTVKPAKRAARPKRAVHHAGKPKLSHRAPLAVPTNLSTGGSTRDFAGLGSYGADATSSTRAAITHAVMTYEIATAQRRWATACSVVAPAVKSLLEHQLAGATHDAKPSCAKTLSALEGNAPKAAFQQEIPNHVVAIRAKGTRGFFLYSAPGVKHGSMPVVLVGSSWDVGSLAGTSL